jgi:ubiquinone/menaquinone biosynthesis C-methylase UbiE
MPGSGERVRRSANTLTPPDAAWRVWGRRADYGELLRRRASGALPEMDSAIATAERAASLLRRGDRVLDVGAGAGHYLRSLKARAPAPFSYVGVDATLAYLLLAEEVWRDERDARFVAGDIYQLPLSDGSADLVLCCNVLLHLPSVAKPLRELVRVARRHVLVRMLLGPRGFRIKEIEGDQISEDGEPTSYNWYNIYPQPYVERVLRSIPRVRAIRVFEDRAFDPERIEAAARDSGASNATRVIGEWQVNGYVLQPWHFVHAELAPV